MGPPQWARRKEGSRDKREQGRFSNARTSGGTENVSYAQSQANNHIGA
jgi:hypothetical protein